MAFEVVQIAAGVHRFSSVFTNWYVIEQGDRVTVLDGGLPRDWRAFSTALERLGIDETAIDAVLITHHHPDHVGNAERLRRSGAKVFSHSADAAFLRGEKHLPIATRIPFLLRPWYAFYMARLLAKGIMRVPPIGELNMFSDGEVLDVPGAPRVIHAPGHTAGSCALFLEDRSLLFSGDALVTRDVTTGHRRGPQVIDGPDTEDVALAKDSLSALAATNAKTVLPGHGEPWWEGIESAVKIARRPTSRGGT
ncbi:MAG TPA: MBL fold metallo-hydrolase [Actinomycetota bacterium]|nr:MBL fold metallo-hydrolase [Actinomycetota bacterium]